MRKTGLQDPHVSSIWGVGGGTGRSCRNISYSIRFEMNDFMFLTDSAQPFTCLVQTVYVFWPYCLVEYSTDLYTPVVPCVSYNGMLEATAWFPYLIRPSMSSWRRSVTNAGSDIYQIEGLMQNCRNLLPFSYVIWDIFALSS